MDLKVKKLIYFWTFIAATAYMIYAGMTNGIEQRTEEKVEVIQDEEFHTAMPVHMSQTGYAFGWDFCGAFLIAVVALMNYRRHHNPKPVLH